MKFKVGPAKFRNGRDCHIMEIMPDGRLAVRRKQTYGNGWAVSTKEADGTRPPAETMTSEQYDVLPNVEPEWNEYHVVVTDSACKFPVINGPYSVNMRADLMRSEAELFRFHYAPGHPIQIISGDYVDAREKDDDAH